MPTALIFGGSGQIGVAAATALAGRGWTVTVATRARRPLPEPLASHRVTPVDAANRPRAQVIAGLGSCDAVVDATAYDDADATDLLNAQGRVGALVVLSSSSVYRDADGRSLDEARDTGFPEFAAPIGEETPTVEPGLATYSTRKVAMERTLHAAKIPVIVLRPCAVYGTFARHLREWWFIKRLLDGRAQIPLAYGGRRVFHTSSASGIASLIEIALRDPRSATLNVADAQAPSVTEIAWTIAAALGRPIDLHPFGGAAGADGVGDTPWSSPRPYVLDLSRATATGMGRTRV
jgi:nucleoside-diphosphate-sugar epimerase